MSTRITFVGGGSTQWMPPLVGDVANTPCLQDAHLVLHDLDEERARRIGQYVQHVADHKQIPLTAETSADLDRALDGADFVVVCISTSGLASMAIDLAVSARHGVPMPIGDTIGPAGISRALRNVPVLVDIARAMERNCPDAWMCNVTNPLTVLTSAVTRETSIKAVGLCHEVTNARFFLSQLLDCGFFDFECTVTGVNHLPIVTHVTVNGTDRTGDVIDYAHGRADDMDAPLPMLDRVFEAPPVVVGGHPSEDERFSQRWTKRAVVDYYAPNFEIVRRHGALPAAAADHTVEFFPELLADAERWGVDLVTVDTRRAREARFASELDRLLASDDVPRYRSPEMVAPVIESLVTGAPCHLPLNIPNHGQCPDLPLDAVVESICTVDANGVRGRDVVKAPEALAATLDRVARSQAATLDAALAGDPDLVATALTLDQSSELLDEAAIVALRDDILTSTSQWLPQFGALRA